MVDRRYGVNKYGDGKLYGASDSREALAWDASIDWDGNSILESNEANKLTSVKVSRGRKTLIQPNGTSFEKIPTGKATIEVLNRDGRFDAWNVDSPLYPNVDAGKDLQLRVRDMRDGTIYPLFKGFITKIVPTGSGKDARAKIYASDGLEFLRNAPARVAMQLGTTPDQAIGMILDAANWPAQWGRSLDVTSDTIPYWWCSGNKKSMSEIEDLALSFLGYFFADNQGRAHFASRANISTSVVDYLQEQIAKEIGTPQPYDIRRNAIRIKVHPRKQAASGVVWQLAFTTPPFIDPGSANSLKLFATYKYNNVDTPATSVSVGNKSMNTQTDGLGIDQTSSCTVALTDFGDTGLVEVTNNSGSRVYLRQLELNGIAIYEPNTSDVTYPKDLTTLAKQRELLFDLRWQQDLNVARDLADVMGPFYGSLQPIPEVKIDNRPSIQFAADLFDIGTTVIPYLGLSGNSFRVGGIEHWTDTQFENCQRVLSRIYLEPYIAASNFMQWDTNAVWDTSTIFGY